MFKWKKLGRVFNPADTGNSSWMKEYAQSPTVLICDQFIRVYFSCRPPQDANGNYLSYLAYVDLNKDDLFEVINIAKGPILQLGELGTFDEFGTNPSSVIRVGEDVRIYYCGWTRCESVPFNSAIGVAMSKDGGETFSKLGNGPVLSYSVDEPFLLGSPRVKHFNNTWYLWYAVGKKWIDRKGKPEPVYKIRMAYSNDGINWQKTAKDLIVNKLEEDECQASPEVFFYNNEFHMLFSYRYSLDYRFKEKGYRIGYASSKDLLNWIRDDSKAGIDISEEGWDAEMISYPHVFDFNKKKYMLYQGNHFGRYGFGLAELEVQNSNLQHK
jgi:predicted GH43/DUF377 family glycosyl hydrolase